MGIEFCKIEGYASCFRKKINKEDFFFPKGCLTFNFVEPLNIGNIAHNADREKRKTLAHQTKKAYVKFKTDRMCY